MKKLLTILVFFPLSIFAKGNLESFYQAIACERYNGAPQTLKDGTQCDIVTDTHAIEVDFARKWAEAIGQSLHYALMTGKHAGILLILESEKDEKHYERLIEIRDSYALPINVYRLEAWKHHFDIEDLSRPKTRKLSIRLSVEEGKTVPIFVDGSGKQIGYPEGFKAVRLVMGWSTKDMGNKLGVSGRTIENWEQSHRRPSNTVMLLLQRLIEEA